MIVDCVRRNFHWVVYWGMILQFAGGTTHAIHSNSLLSILGWLITMIGTILLLVGFSFYVKSKGRNAGWSLFAFLSIVGWIILILLKDKSSMVPAKE